MPRCSSRGPIGLEIAKYQLLKERLIAEFPTSDAETLTDTLEGITDLKEMLAAVIRSSLFDHALAKGLKDRIETMRERLEGLAFRAEKKRELALAAMEEVGLKTLQESDFTASLRPCPPHLVVLSDEQIPEGFWVPQAPEARPAKHPYPAEAGQRGPGNRLEQSLAHFGGEDEVMAFTEQQVRKLKARLNPKHVRVRTNNGLGWSYIEGWHAVAEANRIFGHDGWDRQTSESTLIYAEKRGDWHHAAYVVRVRICVRAGEVLVTREGSGTGEGKALTQGQAHELALKGAETDATKRALATFGNPFGLSLYEQSGGRPKDKEGPSQVFAGPWRLDLGEAKAEEFAEPKDFANALRRSLSDAADIESLFSVWEANIETVRALNRYLKESAKDDTTAQCLVAHLKGCAITIATPPKALPTSESPNQDLVHAEAANASVPFLDEKASRVGLGPRIDKSRLRFGELKRVRSKEHLRFVARQPCLICGRTPSQAHHIRYAQAKGIALKVSDEFTVPLCAIHHMENHATGDERQWWEEHKIDPLLAAESLWRATLGRTHNVNGGQQAWKRQMSAVNVRLRAAQI